MRLKFTKMHGAGNDFVVLDGIRQTLTLTGAQVRHLADRRFGIGADQVLIVEPAHAASADFRYRIFNQDGGEVEHCGNGVRCLAKFVRDTGLTCKRRLRAEVQKGVLTLAIEENGAVTVNMGEAVFEPARMPFDTSGLNSRAEGNDAVWPLEINGRWIWLSVVSMGNPHAVQVVADIDAAQVAEEGALIESHPRFAERVNAGFMQIIAPDTIRLRVYERGAGETLACGTGACAAAVTAIRRGLSRSPVTVHMRGGTLTIAWESGEVLMTGPAVTVFNGEIEI